MSFQRQGTKRYETVYVQFGMQEHHAFYVRCTPNRLRFMQTLRHKTLLDLPRPGRTGHACPGYYMPL